MPAARVYTSKWFRGFAKRESIPDADLLSAVERMESGLVDADLGGGVVKMRIARKGQGKSGGFRVFLIVREAEWCVVYYGFAKSDAENIAPSELADLKRFAAHLLALSDEDRELFFKNKEYLEVK